jgi:hypothetical protein
MERSGRLQLEAVGSLNFREGLQGGREGEKEGGRNERRKEGRKELRMKRKETR